MNGFQKSAGAVATVVSFVAATLIISQSAASEPDSSVLIESDFALSIARVYQYVSGDDRPNWSRMQEWSRAFETVNVGRQNDLIKVVLLPRGRAFGGSQNFTVDLTTGDVRPGPPSR